MNWQTFWLGFAAIASLTGILTTVGCVTFFSGKFAQQIGDNQVRLDRHDVAIEDHSSRLSGHDVEIATLKAWRDGYEAKAAEMRKIDG